MVFPEVCRKSVLRVIRKDVGLLAFKINRNLALGFSRLCLRPHRQQRKVMGTDAEVLHIYSRTVKCVLWFGSDRKC